MNPRTQTEMGTEMETNHPEKAQRHSRRVREYPTKAMSAIEPRKPGVERRPGTFNLLDLFGFYLSRLPLLIAAVIIGALLAGLFTHFFIPDKYTATSRMYMVSASSDSVVNLADLNIGTSLSNDYVELMKTRPIIEEVIDETGLHYSYEQLLGMIDLSVVFNTRIVKISATSTDPKEAMAIANQMARTSRVQLPKLMEAPMPSIAEMAVLPTRRSSPSLTRNVAFGAVALLTVMLGILTWIYLMDDTIKTSEDLEKAFGVMPLSVIPEGIIEGMKKEEEDTDGSKRNSILKKIMERRRRRT